MFDDKIPFGNRIIMLRKAKGITQKQLAQNLLISRATLNNYENGNSFPDYQNLTKIIEYFSNAETGIENLNINFVFGIDKNISFDTNYINKSTDLDSIDFNVFKKLNNSNLSKSLKAFINSNNFINLVQVLEDTKNVKNKMDQSNSKMLKYQLWLCNQEFIECLKDMYQLRKSNDSK